MIFLEQIRTEMPPFIKPQAESMTWLSAAFQAANPDRNDVSYQRLLEKVGVKPAQVAFRGHYLPDYAQELRDAESALIFGRQTPEGKGIDDRMRFYAECSNEIVDRLLQLQDFRESPATLSHSRDLIHVSCTGYVSPSPTQAWIAKHKLYNQVQNYHLYHMGCYAALPAVRIAEGLARSEREVHIVHTELCTLHLRTQAPRLEDLVIHSLFADGGVAYKIRQRSEAELSKPGQGAGPGLQLLRSAEAMLPQSANAMTWGLGSAAFNMTLSKDVPGLVGERLPGFLREIQLPLDLDDERIVWAIHPGGPKIIDHIQEIFRLKDPQVEHSRKVLSERGNMSSATLPYVWKEILEDSRVPNGANVLAMAFGPGLTICLQHFRVHRGSSS